MDPRRWPFTRQALAVQALLVVAVLTVSFAGSAYLLQRQVDVEVGQRALAVARVVAEDDAVRAGVAAASAAAPAAAADLVHGPVQRAAQDARARTGALFVVVTDDRGLRLAHPVPARLGERVSTDPAVALGGGEEVSTAVGTLGGSARAKVPVRAPGGTRVVGEVSVGIGSATVAQRVREALGPFALIALAALVAGLTGAALLARRLRRLTLGLQPEEIAGLLQGHEAVLRGIAEGVVAVDPAGRVVLANDEAARLLGRPLLPGDAAAGLPPQVRALVEHPDAVPSLAVLGERALLLSSRRVEREDRLLGSVVTVQDRTDVELLTRQLDAVQAVGTVLRAQRHEFANRLHLVSGLLGSGHVEEAGEYVRTLLATGPLGTGVAGLDAVADPYLQAFVAAKASHARELGVQLRLGEVAVPGRLADPVDVTTVLGNLVDNAVTAVRGCADAVVEVDLVQDGCALVVAVSDSGPGVAAPVRERVFDAGVTTRASGDGGVGLALVRQVARARGGDAWLADGGAGEGGGRAAGGDRGLGGAVFVARLPGAVAPGAGPEQPWT